MKRIAASTSGFVLLEILPAFFLFSAALLIGLQVLWSEMRIEESGRRNILLGDAVVYVWERWERAGGKAALAVFEDNADWTVYAVPDESWLPEWGAEGSGPDGSSPFLFRRRRIEQSGEPTFWKVEVLMAGGSWKPIQTVLTDYGR